MTNTDLYILLGALALSNIFCIIWLIRINERLNDVDFEMMYHVTVEGLNNRVSGAKEYAERLNDITFKAFMRVNELIEMLGYEWTGPSETPGKWVKKGKR